MIVYEEKHTIKSSGEIGDIMRKILNACNDEDRHKEKFYVIGLTAQNVIQFIDLSAFGTVNHCNPVIREVIRIALIKNSVSIIVCHNHPSGDTTPSAADKTFTHELMKACRVMQISLLDHLIIGDDIFSFADSGIL